MKVVLGTICIVIVTLLSKNDDIKAITGRKPIQIINWRYIQYSSLVAFFSKWIKTLLIKKALFLSPDLTIPKCRNKDDIYGRGIQGVNFSLSYVIC